MGLHLPPIIVPALVSLLFKVGVYIYARLSKTHNFQTRLYLFFLFALSFQNVSEIFALYKLNVHGVMASFEARLFYAASIAAFAPLVHLAVTFAVNERHWLRTRLPAFVYCSAVGLGYLLFFTPLLVKDFQTLNYGFGLSITRIPGPLYFLFEIYSITTFVGVLVLSIYGSRTQNTALKRLKNSVLTIAVFPMATLVVLVLGLLHFGIRLINWSVTFPFAITFFLIVTAYAIHQHRLFDIEFFIPWSKVRKRKTAFYDRIRAMIAELADLDSVGQALNRLADTLRCPVALIGGPQPVLAIAGSSSKMVRFPLKELRQIQNIVVTNEIADSRPAMHALMRDHGIAAIVPFYPHSRSAASWMLLGDSFSEQVYTPLDFKLVEQLFDRLGELFLDKLLFMRSQLHEAREQLQTLQLRLDLAQQESKELREQNVALNRRVAELERRTGAARQPPSQAAPVIALVPDAAVERKTLEQHVEELEARLIARALRSCDGNKAKAARLLGLRPNTLHYKIERYGLLDKKEDPPD